MADAGRNRYKKPATYFYATQGDLEPGIERFETREHVKYVLCGAWDHVHLDVHRTAAEIRDLGVPSSGDHILDSRYLLLPRGLEVTPRQVPQRRGGVRYFVDPECCQYSVVISFGGLFEERCLIVGIISVDPRTSEAIRLYQALRHELTRNWIRVGDYQLGPEAFRLWRAGVRLTFDCGRGAEYDLPLHSLMRSSVMQRRQ